MEIERKKYAGMENKKSYLVSEKNNTIVYLEEVELEAFAYLANRKILTSKQMYKFISPRTQIKEATYLTKFFRGFLHKGLVVPQKEGNSKFGRKNFYRIGPNGIDLLIREGYLESTFNKEAIHKYAKMKNIDHFIATQDIIVNAFASCRENGLCINCVSFTELASELDGDLASLRPDTILRVENRYIHIEMDMASERLLTIQEKIEKYIEFAKKNPDEKHTVVISVADSSFEDGLCVYTETPRKRIKNIKEVLLSTAGLHEENLSIYVLPFSRTHQIVFDILQGEKPYAPLIPNIAVKVVTKTLELQNKKFDQTFSPIEPSKVLPNHTPGCLMPEGCFAVGNSFTSHDHYAIFTFLEEGNIQRMDRLHYLESILEEMKLPVGKIVALYRNADELTNDVLNGEYGTVIFGDTHALSEYIEDIPVFFRTISPLRKGKVFYDDL